MDFGIMFFVNSIMLGVGLAMDAFSISLADGLNDPRMKPPKMCAVAGTFAFFQALMPLIGWVCVHTIVEKFKTFEKFIPWIALALLGYIGGKMLFEGLRKGGEERVDTNLTFGVLMLQGVATSIDALSVGFTISDYNWVMALVAALLISVVTFIICIVGLIIGRCCGTKFADKAGMLGGAILIIIGIEIFVTGII